jgi:hypothetical protein
MPWVGLSEATRFGEGGTFIAVDAKIDYIDREGMRLLNDEITRTVVGIPINDLHHPIQDPRVRDNILKALEKITFHVEYRRTLSEEFKQRTLLIDGCLLFILTIFC